MNINTFPASVAYDQLTHIEAILGEFHEQISAMLRNVNVVSVFPEMQFPLNLMRSGIYSYLEKVRNSISIHDGVADYNDADKIASQTLYACADISITKDNAKVVNSPCSLIGQIIYILKNSDREFNDIREKLAYMGTHEFVDEIRDKINKIIQGLKNIPSNIKSHGCFEDGDVPLGILTVLEHEFQSVVRRMSVINAISDNSSYGRAILNRSKPEDDLKDIARGQYGINYTKERIGWAVGKIGERKVVVLCVGFAGEKSTKESIEYFDRYIAEKVGVPVSPSRWVVVGICAGSDKNWELGTVLVSKDHLIGMHKTHASASKWLVNEIRRPLYLDEGKIVTLLAKQSRLMFRPKPSAPDEESVLCDDVIVKGTKFLCSNVVIDSLDARNDALTAAYDHEESGKKILEEKECLGIEMEGCGTPYNSLVIKAVCDYADDKKGSQWDGVSKNLLQLYAAELAAEATVSAVGEL